ncbi:glutathione-disulfide reductase [Advenella kashmirensis]|nr:glutathione-disulfide reductase [Advenella kashmirensis]
MESFDYDFFVIGGGSGGVRASRMAAQAGVRVAVAEGSDLGGTCVNVGCIPKKLYSYAAHYHEAFEEARGFGWNVGEATLDWSVLKTNRATEISRLNGIYHSLITNAGATLLTGWAELAGPNTVRMDDGKTYTAKHILIATGGWPVVPDFPGREHVITSNEIFDVPQFPKRLVVVGAGYIACEFASIFNGLGAQVHIVIRRDRILRGFDEEICAFTAKEMEKAGVHFHFETKVDGIDKEGDVLSVKLNDGTTLQADQVLYATGRAPNVQKLNLESAGVQVNHNGAIQIDENYRTSAPSIYALGDVTDRIQLTPVALGEAMVLVDHLFGKGVRRMSYEFIPTAIFTHPNVGTVGYSEHEAREKYGEVTIYRSEFRPLKHTLSGSTARMMMKLIVDKKSDRVVGLHMAGDDAGEIVQGFAVAVRMGATKADFDATIGIHPTAAEEFVTMRG